MIKLDGSFLEGGGQMVRTALGMSAITGKPFSIYNIRKNRPKPGLKNQHIQAIKILEKICKAEVIGNELGSTSIDFVPQHFKPRSMNIDMGTAGSISLLLQGILLPLIFGGKNIKLNITGGTDVSFSPTIDYFKFVVIPQLRKYADIDLKVIKRGFYPKGQGKIQLTIKPKYDLNNYDSFDEFQDYLISEEKPIMLTRQNKLILIKGTSVCSKQLMAKNVAERQERGAKLSLLDLGIPIEIRTEYCDSADIGTSISLFAYFTKKGETDLLNPVIIGSDRLGEKEKKAEKVGEEAALMLKERIASTAPVDMNLADNLLTYMALFGGNITAERISDHTKTNIHVIEKFVEKKFDIKDNTISI